MKASTMHLRPSARLLAAGGALALATVLSSCGFDYATDRVYTPGASVNDRSADIDVLGAAVVSGQEGSGTFIATFANNNEDLTADAGSVDSITGAGDDPVTVDTFEPITVPAGGLTNIADDGIVVEGAFGPGGYVTLAIGFGNGESVTIGVPVVAPCDEFEGLDSSGDGTEVYECDVESDEPAEH